ncbi:MULTISPECIES: TetR/AcrR family transcriptional regulator [Thalassospira]|uniref:TetR family transcriptional regulator n=2 Tax=Thalassospira TaxID=168934 RepID=A0A367VZJ5_9PROT|nr:MULTISPECIES: TetR/AcrR family transcriptional regulator [Thalassospira]MDG4720341.1 TetR/AcrR family transcriptional regulator [Thalassospira sp. FZY0004]RCK32166.1 TetR family transcriptional regulator [Thalassospira profundimaris]
MAAKTRAEKMEETRVKLIAAGRKAFAQKGYADASMDELTASAGLTRGALYHNFGDKLGLLAAVVDEIDSAMAQQAKDAGDAAGGGWNGLMAEGRTYIELALDPEIQRIVLRDGPAFLGDPSNWPSQNRCLQATIATLGELADQGAIKSVDIEALARMLNGVALNAALWVATSEDPQTTLHKAISAFECLASGVLVKDGDR